jgi:hypothetical protein
MPVKLFLALMRLLGCPVCASCDCAAPNGPVAYSCGWSRGDDGWVCGACCELSLTTWEAGYDAE